jgi:hypothetical protein
MENRTINKIIKNPFLAFAPFLLLYIILALVFPTDGLSGDEGRYLIYAHYMITGSLPINEVNIDILGNGPGYSIILIPFVALRAPLICITILNCLLYYFSIILLFKTLIKFVSLKKSFLLCLFWACYYNLYENMISILPETFTAFLTCLLIFFLVKAFSVQNLSKPVSYINKYLIISGIIIGFIELTKPIFGYVLVVMLFGLVLLAIVRRKNPNYYKGLVMCFTALAFTAPYLIYTYNITGKFYYWSTFGGNNLYWMTTPFTGEYGNWMPDPAPVTDSTANNYHYNKLEKFKRSETDDLFLSEYNTYIKHKKDFDSIYKYTGVKRDELYKKISIKNIKMYPAKFIENCISNTGRIFFNYPYSYNFQTPKTLLRFPLNGVIVVLMLFCAIPTFTNWEKIDFAIKFMLLFGLIYLAGSIVASAETRMFTIVAPLFLTWIAFIIQKTLKINITWKKE